MPIILYESLRGLFYAPFYAAIELGAYAEEGLDVRLGHPAAAGGAAEAVLDGTADLTWGGPMRLMQHHDRDPGCGLVGFAEVVTRDPFFVIGAEPRPDFRFRDLLDVRLASVAEVPTPWMCLQDDIRRAGIDPARLDRIGDRSMAENVEALLRGEVDAIQVFQPYAEQLIRGGAHLWYAAATRGPTSYTCLYTLRRTFEAKRETMRAMTRAIYRTQRWVHAHPAAALAERIQPYFPALSHGLLTDAVGRYFRLGLYGRDPILPVVGFVRLKSALLSGGFIRRDVPFDAAVDNELAREVIAEDPPPLGGA